MENVIAKAVTTAVYRGEDAWIGYLWDGAKSDDLFDAHLRNRASEQRDDRALQIFMSTAPEQPNNFLFASSMWRDVVQTTAMTGAR